MIMVPTSRERHGLTKNQYPIKKLFKKSKKKSYPCSKQRNPIWSKIQHMSPFSSNCATTSKLSSPKSRPGELDRQSHTGKEYES